jgi:hypothetical protein
MVSRESQNTARAVNNLLESRDILGLLAVAGGAAGGVLLTNRIANRVLPAVGLSPTPSTVLEGVGAAGLKTAVAAGFMYGATQVQGTAKVVLAFLSLGSLTSAGFDLAGLFFDVPSLSQVQGVSASSGSARVVSSTTANQTVVPQDEQVRFREGHDGSGMMMEEQFR